MKDRVLALRVFLEEAPTDYTSSTITLPSQESRHLVSVYRARQGDQLVAFDGTGNEWQATLLNAHPRKAEISVNLRKTISKPKPDLILIQAYPKNKNWDAELRQATEIGISEIRVAVTKFSQADLKSLEDEGKREKWRQTCIEACKQSGNPFLPKIPAAKDLTGHLEDFSPESDLCLLGSLEKNRLSIHQVIENWMKKNHGKLPNRVICAVGPEGDFSAEEYSLLKASHFQPVVLAPWVLRVDTAAVAFLGATQSILEGYRLAKT